MKHGILLPVIACAALFGACDRDIPTVNLGIDDVYFIPRMAKLPLESALTGAKYSWKVNGEEVSSERSYIFIASEEGVYNLSFDIIDDATPYHFDFTVTVMHEDVEYSPYITKVYEYCPAPGQFINEMPKYEDGDTYEDILKKAEESISGTNDVLVSLGSYGGYITFGFDHSVVNIPGEKDFRIWGNAFYSLTNPEAKGGSAEPGIVMVSYDTNCNGLPDDEWYELAGSAYNSAGTLHNYGITYHRPDPNRTIESDPSGMLNDIYYIAWDDTEGTRGYVAKNTFHAQDYYPKWVKDDVLTFSGTRLPQNAVDESGAGTYYVLYAFDWGYVDNHPNDYADLNSFDISWAVDRNGHKVDLPAVDFIRVYTGINQYCGWLGETSTELCRAQDLHIDIPGTDIPSPVTKKNK